MAKTATADKEKQDQSPNGANGAQKDDSKKQAQSVEFAEVAQG